MKTSLDHLPTVKREQLQRITQLITEQSPADMVVLFGSYARGDWVEDRETLYYSDYDLLVVVDDDQVAADAALWNRIESQVGALARPCPVNLVVHEVRQLNDEIRRGRYFFSDVMTEGVSLFDNKRFSLAKVKALTPEQRLEQRRHDFRYWFGSASHFWHGVAYYVSQQQWAHAAFSLHQAAERYFHAVLLVFTGYKPRTHNLDLLAEQVAPLHSALVDALPRSTEHDAQLFDLLKRAYIEARYSKAYRISRDQLSELRTHVRELASRALTACREELGNIVTPDAVGELPEPPDERDPYELPPPPADLGDSTALSEWEERIAWAASAHGRAEREGGRREGEARGREEGVREGEARGLREAIATACELLDIELTPERQRYVQGSNVGELQRLLTELRQRRQWPES